MRSCSMFGFSLPSYLVDFSVGGVACISWWWFGVDIIPFMGVRPCVLARLLRLGFPFWCFWSPLFERLLQVFVQPRV